MKCPSCGGENPDYAMYCGKCANPVRESVQTPERPHLLPPSGMPLTLRDDETITSICDVACNLDRREGGRSTLWSVLVNGPACSEHWGFGGCVLLTNQRFVLAQQRLALNSSYKVFISTDLENIVTCDVISVLMKEMLELTFSGEYSEYTAAIYQIRETDTTGIVSGVMSCRQAQEMIRAAIAKRRQLGPGNL